jgi:ubiquilin
MKVTFKTLAGQLFSLDFSSGNVTIGEVKHELIESQKYLAEGLKLVFNGVVLTDDNTLEKVGVTEKNFVVLMGKKTKLEHKKPVEEDKKEVKTEVKPTVTNPTTNTTTTTTNTQQTTQDIPSLYQNTQQPTSPFGEGSPFGGGNLDYDQIAQSPEYQQLMGQLLQDPQFVQSLIQSNPQLAQLYQTNPELIRQMLSSPEFIQNVMQLQGMMDQGGHDHGGEEQHGGEGTGYTHEEAKVIFATQLQQLKDMGFSDEESNITALIAANGNVDGAIDVLMSSFN